MADPSAVAATTVAIGQTVIAYQFFLPKIGDVRRAAPSDATIAGDVYIGQLGAGVMTLAVGAMLSGLTGSSLPMWTALVLAAVTAGIYHYALTRRAV